MNQIYTCPMHPEVVRDAPGICPECGMRLIAASQKNADSNAEERGKSQDTHDKHEGHSTEMFLQKFWVSLILTIPVLLYSDIVRTLSGWQAPPFAGSQYLPLIFGSIVFFYGGWIFLVGAWRELKARLPGMMTLIGLAITAAYLWSVYAVFVGGETLFWELTTLITVMLLGHWLEMRAVSGAQSALKELAKLLPDVAEVIRGQKTETVPVSELKEGDVVLVRPGAKVPADGVIIEGKSEVNEAMVTGESRPVLKSTNQEVIAGTINGDGSLQVKVTKIGEYTFLAGVMRLVAEAQASKSRLQVLSDRAALYLTSIAVLGGTVTFGAWLFAGDGFAFAVTRLVAVLVIACPHALGLAVPLIASISTTKAARSGLLIKQRLALESARNIETVLFDKTGTLTKGAYGVTDLVTHDVSEEELLRAAASINSASEHPTAHAVVAAAKEREITAAAVREFQRIPGRGVEGVVEGKIILSGSEVLFQERNIALPEELKRTIDRLAKEGKTVNLVAQDNIFIGAFAMADIIREESRQAISALSTLGINVVMITGDSEDVAAWVAGELGIKEYFARVLPEEKVNKVKLLQQKGQKVAMVGDGINDAPALTQADLGIAIGAGTNVAIESAGIILVRNDPRDIVKIIKLSRLTYTKMLQNLFWATGYNIVALPLAAGVLAFKGILLQPALAALFMSLSTVIVAINAVLLRNKSL